MYKRQVKDYYNGYKVQGSGENIYRTLSVMSFLQTEELNDYWNSTDGITELSSLCSKTELRRVVSKLLDWENITIKVERDTSKFVFQIYKDAMAPNCNCTRAEAECILWLLTDTGYFNPTLTKTGSRTLNIPNREIYQHLRKQCIPCLLYTSRCV